MKKIIKILAFLLLIPAVFSCSKVKDTVVMPKERVTISGKVLDADGQEVRGAFVICTVYKSTQVFYTCAAVTAGDGSFVLKNVAVPYSKENSTNVSISAKYDLDGRDVVSSPTKLAITSQEVKEGIELKLSEKL